MPSQRPQPYSQLLTFLYLLCIQHETIHIHVIGLAVESLRYRQPIVQEYKIERKKNIRMQARVFFYTYTIFCIIIIYT